MPTIDLAFDVRGTTIPLDYGYALFSALCRIVPELHGDRRVGVHPVRGVKRAPGLLTLVPQSKLRLRMPSELIGSYLGVGGATLDLDGASLQVGVPRMESLTPAPLLTSRLVTIAGLSDPAEFEASARRQLESIGVAGEFAFLPSPDPARVGEPSRRVIRVKGRKIVGFAACVSGLTAEESLLLQERGIGSRRRMGCGMFVRTSGGRFDG